MVAHGIIQLTSVEVVAAEQRRRRNQRAAAEAEETIMTVDVQVGLRLQEEVLQEALHNAPGHPKVQGLVAEAADGDIQEGKPQDHPQEAVPLVGPLASPLPIHDRYVEITCRGNVKGNLRTASFGIPTLHVLQEGRMQARQGLPISPPQG